MNFQEPGTCYPLQSFLHHVCQAEVLESHAKKDFHYYQDYDTFGHQIRYLQISMIFFEK